MVPEFKVKFSAIDQVQKFIDDIRKVPYEVDACHGHYVVDAKSVLGILSLSLGREIVLIPHTLSGVDYDFLQKICEEYK